MREASLYRNSDDPTDRFSETQLDTRNATLAALRYLVIMIDARQMVRMKGKGGAAETAGEDAAKAKEREKKWVSRRNEFLGRRIL